MSVPAWVLEDLARSKVRGHKGGPIVKVKRGPEMFEGTDYPRGWSGFVGQVQAKEQLQVAVASAKARHARLEHTLLASGQHGVGKSTLATLLAYKAEVGIVQATGPIDIDKGKRILGSMNDHDVLFIDEFHNMVAGGKAKAEWLLPFMTEGVMYTDAGAIDCPDITIVGATTDAGRLPETFLSRFVVKPKLVVYNDTEAGQIASALAKRMDVDIAEEHCAPIAKAANGNPRDMRSILTAIRDLRLAFPSRPINLPKAFDWAGFSADGLTLIARDLLMVLVTQHNYTASSDSLQAILGEPGPLRHHEQMLMQRGFLTITGRGRTLTEAGTIRAEELRAESAA